MARTRVIRFLGHAGNNFNKFFEENERIRKIASDELEKLRKQKSSNERNDRRATSTKSKIPAILELHKQLNSVRRQVNEIRRSNPESPKIAILERRYHHIDELLMSKLKNQ
ncbi:MAG: hypothetical protein AABX51_05590 [Nanoarchaeota archaeon]|mgnify:FL=1